MDAELEFAIQPNTTGKQLFDQVSFNPTKHAILCACLCVVYMFVCPWWCAYAEAR